VLFEFLLLATKDEIDKVVTVLASKGRQGVVAEIHKGVIEAQQKLNSGTWRHEMLYLRGPSKYSREDTKTLLKGWILC